MINKCS